MFTTITESKLSKNVNEGWFTKEIKQLIKDRDVLYRKKCKYPENEYVARLYNQKKLDVKNHVRYNKKQYFEKRVMNAEGSAKKFWDIIKGELCMNNTSTQSCSKLLKNNGDIIVNKKDISNVYNEHFSTVAENLLQSAFHSNLVNNGTTLKWIPDRSLFIKQTDTEEITKIINNLKTNASAGYDNIKVKVIKRLKAVLAPTIAKIINNNIKQGIFPDELKVARITPLYKGGNKQDLNNYRPVSVLPVFSKIYEKVIHQRLITFLEDIKFLKAGQNGFRERRSTLTAATDLLSFIYGNLEKKRNVSSLVLDFRKAFDIIDHGILLKKMKTIGIDGPSL